MFVLYFGLFVWSLVVIYRQYKTFFVPQTIISVTWALFPGLASLGVLDLYPLSFRTHIVIIVAFFSFFLGYHTKLARIKFVFRNRRQKKTEYEKQASGSYIEAGYVNYKLLIMINIIIMIWLGRHLGASLAIIQSKGFHALRAVYQDNFSESTIVNIIYNWFAKPFVISSLAISAYDIIIQRNKKQIVLLICVTVNILLDTFVFAARATLVKFIVYIFFAFFFCKKREYTKRQKILIVILIAFGFGIISYITGQRNSAGYSDFSIFDTVSMYYVAPFGLLNYYINNPAFANLEFDKLLFGRGTFGFLYNIFRSALYVLLGAEYNGSDYINQQITQQFVYVAPRVRVNAECTAAYIFMRDFSYLGVLIGFALVAIFCRMIKNMFDDNPSIRNGALYIIMLYVIFRLVSTYDFLGPATFFSMVFVLISTIDFTKILKFR